MSTVTTKKTLVTPTWNTQQIQEAASRAMATNCMAAMTVLSKNGEQAVKEYQDMIHKFQLEHLKSIGVKTPLELVKAKAEFETNVFGSKIEIEGDDNCAKLNYLSCAMWESMQKVAKLTPEQQEKMGANFQTCVQNFAKEWGFKGEVKMDETCCTISFSK
ncbi:MAG: hypothetical protein K2W82_12275 [Candidatus Obscuribacterales bacterium]|nr:hypothetical protein [Candidatus Obscuribacterales bacterium]